jgi:hypothetical protein
VGWECVVGAGHIGSGARGLVDVKASVWGGLWSCVWKGVRGYLVLGESLDILVRLRLDGANLRRRHGEIWECV